MTGPLDDPGCLDTATAEIARWRDRKPPALPRIAGSPLTRSGSPPPAA